MKKLNPEKLYVEFRQGVTDSHPVIGRRYTLTHSDITAELFLTIGLLYAFDKINPMRDEVLAQWQIINNQPALCCYVYVNGEFGSEQSAVRNAIFVRELPLALEAVRYGDRKFFEFHFAFDCAPIYIHFDSSNPCFNRVEYWGTPSDYNKD